MIFGEKPAVASEVYTFTEVVDEACEKLMEQQIKYSIRRIQKMEEQLSLMERELDDFLLQKDKLDKIKKNRYTR
jgi:hypothetical protein